MRDILKVFAWYFKGFGGYVDIGIRGGTFIGRSGVLRIL